MEVPFAEIQVGSESGSDGWPIAPWQSLHIGGVLDRHHPNGFVLSDHASGRSGRPKRASDIEARSLLCLPLFLYLYTQSGPLPSSSKRALITEN